MGYTQQDFKHLCSAMKFFRARSKRFALELEGARLLGDSGFIFLGTMASDIAAMGRLEACLQKEPDQGLTIRIESGAQYIDEQMTGHLRGKQKGFLGAKKTLSSLSARVYALGVMTLKVKLDEYKDAVSTHEGLDSLRARFLAFITEIEKFEQRADLRADPAGYDSGAFGPQA